MMSEGQFEADKAIYDISPHFALKPICWGKYLSPGPDHYFLLAEFREIGQQPPEPKKLTARLAEFHKNSVSPTGKFGFHTTTCHGKTPQLTNIWKESWEELYHDQLKLMMELDIKKHGHLAEFEFLSKLVLDICIPKLLRPLQSEGRSIKPCLVHLNIWDQNTATDIETGEPFIFDGSAFYAHNEYELGNWRSPRHRLSGKAYIRNYKNHFPASQPGTSKHRYQSFRADTRSGAKKKNGIHEIFPILCVLTLRLEYLSQGATTVSCKLISCFSP